MLFQSILFHMLCLCRDCAAYLASGSVVKLHQGEQSYSITRWQGGVLLTYGARCRTYDESGAAAAKVPIMWTRGPQKIAFAKPYIAAVEEGGTLEVQLYAPFAASKICQTLQGLPQKITLADTCLEDGSLMLLNIASGDVLQVQPAPHRQAAEQLLDAGEYEDALALCRLIPEEQVSKREECCYMVSTFLF